MANYSNSDLQAMKIAFSKAFNIDKSLCDNPEIIKWMTEAAESIVEYDGKFKNESVKDRDIRMELVEVYDGNVNDLVNLLRRSFREYRALTKWEMLFKIANEISSVNELTERAKSQQVFSGEVEKAISQTPEEHPISQSTSTEIAEGSSDGTTPEPQEVSDGIAEEPHEEVSVTSDTMHAEEVAESSVNEESVSVSEVNSSVSEQVTEETKPQEVAQDEPTQIPSEQSTGNVQSVPQHSLSNTSINVSMEEKTMENSLQKMLETASKVSGDAAQAQTAPAGSNTAAADTAKSDEVKAAVVKVLEGQVAERNAWARQNVVTKVVSTQKPAALRTTETVGLPTTETEQEEAIKKIDENIQKFLNGVTGKTGMTLEAFAGLTDDEKYANVYGKDDDTRIANVIKARAMYELLMQIKQNPMTPIPAYIPTADKVSYATKGYAINGKPMNIESFIVEVIDKTNGVIYGEGSVTADGKDASDNAVSFKIGVANQKETNSTGVNTAVTAKKVPVVRPRNKKEFIKGGQNIVFLFDKMAEGENAIGTASFKAAIQGADGLTNAVIPVYVVNDGKREVRETKKQDGTPSYKTKMISINCSVKVQKVVKEVGADFKGDMNDDILVANYWGIKLPSTTAKKDFANISQVSQAASMEVFELAFAGQLSLSAGLKKSKTLADLQTAANAKTEEDAKEAADALA